MRKEEIHYFDLAKVLKEKAPKLAKKLPGFVVWIMRRIIHENKMNHYLEQVSDTRSIAYFKKIIEIGNVTIEHKGLDLLDPNEQYIFVSNHPLGGYDGACILSVLSEKFGENLRAFVNDILMNMEYAEPIFLPINKHGANSKKYAQMGEEAYDSGKQILIFPAGLVSRKRDGIICDPVWKKNFIKKAVDKKRKVVPIYFEGKNSRLFYFISRFRKILGIKANIEMVLLPHEAMCHENKTFKIHFGKPIDYTKFDKTQRSHNEWAKIVQEDCYKMGGIDISKLDLKKLI